MNNKNIIRQIKNIRAKNNDKWMRLLEIAFKYAPDESRKLMGDITDNDMKVSKLSRKLANGLDK